MNIKEIKEMINLMNENNLSELELERDGLRVRLKKQPGGSLEATTEHLVAVPSIKKEGVPETEDKFRKTVEIKAPMVGTFYAAPGPDAPAFVDIGKEIDAGEVICIIEAMKLMNEIKSEIKGKIVEILVENGNPVEFGQTLFLVEPT